MNKETFLVGAATAAHQVEGNNIHSDSWIMENLEHSAYVERSGESVDHYNRYEEDIQLLSSVGCNAYRFSIEWARIEPKEGIYDKKELEHYRAVLDCCEANNITPIVTLHHFSSPAWLIGKGGWGDSYVENAFAKYAEYVVSNIDRKIPYICTINEANMGAQLKRLIDEAMEKMRQEGNVQVGVNMDMDTAGEEEQANAFGCDKEHINPFLMGRSPEQELFVMRAHQKAYQAIKNVSPNTKVGLTLSLLDYQPEDDGKEEAAKLWAEDFGFYLPYIKEDDFLGVQNYTRSIVTSTGISEPSKNVPLTQMGYEDYPEAIGHVLRKVAKEFTGELMVTENGIATSNDKRRCEFIKKAYAGVEKCVKDGLPVIGYCHWSLLDNFEWQAGFGKTFGLIAVDRTTQKRTPKESLQVLGALL